MPNRNKGNQAARKGEKVDLLTKTPKILSKKIKRKPKAIPKARLTPIPPRLLKEATATAIKVKIKADTGILQRLCRTSR
jgi:hypothetical protein